MRWHEQIATKDDEARLPGLADGTVTRTFDAPEALNASFHEIRAKSALNRVPGGNRLPFGWTVNPYRGCRHACSYCSWSESQVLLADGRTRRIADLQVGDEIYGTRVDGNHRRYVKTQVLDRWSVVKPAYRTTLADGTQLITSGDHRVLTQARGWKHVTGSRGGPAQRPCLTAGSSLLGTGRFATPPVENVDYRRGYLCGLIRGDGRPKEHRHKRPGRGPARPQSLRSALTDDEALIRARLYLASFSVSVNERALPAATATHRAVRSTLTSARPSHGRVRQLIRIPVEPSADWHKGFLAGIFDAEGSFAAGASALRISNCDSGMIAGTESALEHFGFDYVVEDSKRPGGLRAVRLGGGLREQLRFFHLTDPAITRKRDIEGRALKPDADTRVVSVEPLGEAMRLYDITTGTGDYVADGVVHHNCFARPTHEYLDLDAGKDFDEQIVVKVNAPEVLRAELKRPSWTGEHVALGTNTDPYQWVEKRYGLTRAILEALRDARNPCSVLTKSPLLLRDLDVFLELCAVTEFSACLSIPTLDEKAWRATEPHTPHPRKRIEAVAELNAAGVPTGVLIAPLMPHINDAPEQVEALVTACREAGARTIGGQALFLRGSTKAVFLERLEDWRPELVPVYQRLYGNGAFLSAADRQATEGRLRALTGRKPTQRELAERFQRGASLRQAGHGVATRPEPAGPREPLAVQEKLF